MSKKNASTPSAEIPALTPPTILIDAIIRATKFSRARATETAQVGLNSLHKNLLLMFPSLTPEQAAIDALNFCVTPEFLFGAAVAGAREGLAAMPAANDQGEQA